MLEAGSLRLETLKTRPPESNLEEKFATEGSRINHKFHEKVMQCGKELDLPHATLRIRVANFSGQHYVLGKYYGQAERPISTG